MDDKMRKSRSTSESSKKKSLLINTLQKCKSFGRLKRPVAEGTGDRCRSKSVHPGNQVVMPGCLAVRVGPNKERFVIRLACVHHPLFKQLLDEAEGVYGYAGVDGPLHLPCDVDVFQRVIWDMEHEDDEDLDDRIAAASTPAPLSPLRCISPIHLHVGAAAAGRYHLMSTHNSRLIVAGNT